MAFVYINGYLYYTKSVRRGARVTSECWATGEDALLLARLDMLVKEEEQARRREEWEREREQTETRRARNEETKALREQLDSIERAMAEYVRVVGKKVGAILTGLGYHRPNRGKWRRRRVPMSNEVAETTVRELFRLAQEGDQIALGELAYHASRALKPPDPYSGELGRTIVQQMLIDQVAEEYDPLRDAVADKLESLRRELAPRGSSRLGVAIPPSSDRTTRCRCRLDSIRRLGRPARFLSLAVERASPGQEQPRGLRPLSSSGRTAIVLADCPNVPVGRGSACVAPAHSSCRRHHA